MVNFGSMLVYSFIFFAFLLLSHWFAKSSSIQLSQLRRCNSILSIKYG